LLGFEPTLTREVSRFPVAIRSIPD